jgi:hypothetical protein
MQDATRPRAQLRLILGDAQAVEEVGELGQTRADPFRQGGQRAQILARAQGGRQRREDLVREHRGRLLGSIERHRRFRPERGIERQGRSRDRRPVGQKTLDRPREGAGDGQEKQRPGHVEAGVEQHQRGLGVAARRTLQRRDDRPDQREGQDSRDEVEEQVRKPRPLHAARPAKAGQQGRQRRAEVHADDHRRRLRERDRAGRQQDKRHGDPGRRALRDGDDGEADRHQRQPTAPAVARQRSGATRPSAAARPACIMSSPMKSRQNPERPRPARAHWPCPKSARSAARKTPGRAICPSCSLRPRTETIQPVTVVPMFAP